jgi:hypothetical protein
MDLVFPLRHSQWTSVWIGAAAVFCAAAVAASAAAAALPVVRNGTQIVLIFGLLWFGLFFASIPAQQAYARKRDLGRPGVTLRDGVLRAGETEIRLPAAIEHGWFDVVAGGRQRTRRRHSYLVVAGVYFWADDSNKRAQRAGWPRRVGSNRDRVPFRMWEQDLLALMAALTATGSGAPIRTSL